MIQTAILILSGLAFWLSTNERPGRIGYVIGLLAQPLWIWETWHAAQWGMFALSLCFFIGYARGLWRTVSAADTQEIDRRLRMLHQFEEAEAIAVQYLPNGQRREWPIADSSAAVEPTIPQPSPERRNQRGISLI